MQKITSRFGQNEFPLIVRRKLQDIKQENKTVEEFSEQVQEMVPRDILILQKVL